MTADEVYIRVLSEFAQCEYESCSLKVPKKKKEKNKIKKEETISSKETKASSNNANYKLPWSDIYVEPNGRCGREVEAEKRYIWEKMNNPQKNYGDSGCGRFRR